MGSLEHILLVAATLMIISVVASKAGSRLGVPALLLFLLIGISVGPHGMAEFTHLAPETAQALGTVALIFILFAGGMDTKVEDVKPVVGPALVLSTVGVVVSTLLIGSFARLYLGFSFVEGCLLGATISSTDVAAVFSVLRSKAVSLKSGIAPLLELESALNDPMAVFLGVALLGLVTHKMESVFHFLPLFVQQMILGAGIGWAAGRGAGLLINRLRLEFEGLYPVLSLGLVLLTYSLTQLVGGSGFLAVYVAGIVLGNRALLQKRTLLHFHGGIAWLMQIMMFLAMGLLVSPAQLWAVAPGGIALSMFLVFVARPASVLISLPGGKFGFREKGIIAWGGLRGSVPIILALFLLAAKIPKAEAMFHLVFFVTFTSVLLQGTTIPHIARWLQVDLPFKEKARFPIEFYPMANIRNNLVEVAMNEGARAVGKSLLELGLPEDVLVVLLRRGTRFLVPKGGTIVEPSDILLVVTESRSLNELRELLV
ncbi:MAG: potassium/proton antiporter [Bdellovibrionota bacterium]